MTNDLQGASAPSAAPGAGPSGTMRAARFDAATGELAVRRVPIPRPDRGEVLVRVAACGICHSDLSQLEGRIRPHLPAVTPGHEASGRIAALGEGVEGWAEEEPVVMAAGRACGRCASCRLGGGVDDCDDIQIMAFHYDGAWAEYVVVPAAMLVRVPETIPLEQAAVLADAVSTPYGAIETAQLRPAEAVGVWGLGGLGTHLVQLARMCGASPIVALDPLPAARERALGLGADFALDPGEEETPRRLKEITGGAGLRVAFDCVGREAAFAQADSALGPRGRLVLIGISRDTFSIGSEMRLVAQRRTVIGHTGYRMRHLRELVELVDRGRLDVSGSVSDVLPLEEVAEGVRRLREHEGNPIRILLRP